MAGVRRVPLVGRSAAVGDLVALLDEAAAGRGGAAVVFGEPGIGKTRLVEELAGHAEQRGARVAWGRCTELDGVPPFWPWRQVLDVLQVGGPPAPSRERVLETVLGAVAGAADGAPVLLCVEDLHWADGDSRWLLRAVIDATAGRRLAVVCTWRSPDGLDELGRLPPRVARVALSALPPPDAEALADALADGALPPGAGARAAAESGGNPLFIRELVRMRSSGPVEGRVPQGVRDVLSRRLARLPSGTVAVLTAAAVLGGAATPERLAAVQDRSPDGVLDALAAASDAGLVEAPGPGPVLFVHAVIREVLLEQAGPARLARLHELAARALAGSAGGPWDEALARHWAAVPGAQAAEQAARHGRLARDRARRSRALDQAVAFAELVAERSGDLEDRLVLGDARARAGDLPGARADLLAVAGQARDSQRWDLVARAALALAAGESGFEVPLADDAQVDLLEEAGRHLPAGALRARVRARLTIATSVHTPLVERIDLARAAVAEAETAGDDSALLQVLAAYADMLGGPGRLAERHQVANRMLALAQRTRDRDGELLARRFLLVALLEQGDFPAADQQIATFERISRSTHEPAHLWYVPLWHGMRALLSDRVAEAEAYADEAALAGVKANSANAAILVSTLRLAIRWGRADVAELVADIETYESAVGAAFPPFEAALAGAYALAGDAARCAPHYRRLAAAGFGSLPEDAEFLSTRMGLAEAALLLADRAGAEALLGQLAPYARLWIVDGIGAACLGVVAEWLARLERLLGRAADAERHRADAVAAYRAAGALRPLRRLQATAAGGEPAGELRREPGGWVVSWHGRSTVLPDLKGVRDLAVLVARPGTPMPAVTLLAGAAGLPVPPAGGSDEVLDERARAAYRQRLRELEDEIAESVGSGRLERAERLRAERGFLVHELSAALGLGGRPRRLGDEADRARKAVTMRIRDAISRLDAPMPDLARHLRDSVRTGRECCYAPDRDVTWRTTTGHRSGPP